MLNKNQSSNLEFFQTCIVKSVSAISSFVCFVYSTNAYPIESKAESLQSKMPQTLNTDPMSSSYLLQLVLGLVFVLFCIIILAWLAKRVNHFQSSGDYGLKIIGGLSMGSREKVILLQVGDQQLLLGVSPGRINTLHVIDEKTNDSIKTNHSDHKQPFDKSFSEKLKNTIAAVTVPNSQKGDVVHE